MGGYSWAQTLTKVTSLDDINETDSYVLQYNGGNQFYTTTYYIYAASESATNISVSTTVDESNTGYYFKFEINNDGTYQILNQLSTNHYLYKNQLIISPQNYYKVLAKGDGTFCIANCWNTTDKKYNVMHVVSPTQFGFSSVTEDKLSSYYYYNIYKVETTKQITAYIHYYDTKIGFLKTKTIVANAGTTSFKDNIYEVPSYIDATYYAKYEGGVFSDELTEDELKENISEAKTIYVKTDYNSTFPYPTNKSEYFAIKTGSNYLGTTFGLTPTYNNRKEIAVRLDGNWIDGYSIISNEGEKLIYNGTTVVWSSEEDYRWALNSTGNALMDKDQLKYLAIYSSNCVLSESATAELASTEAAETILKGMTAEYVGQYDESQTGSVTFDDLVKGNNTLDFTNGTYYFVENATNESDLLSSNVGTTYGNTLSAGDIAMSTAKNFSGLWKYEGGQFVHANSGLKLTSSGLKGTGATWSKTATGTDCVYTLSDGTNYLELNENINWKFRIVNSMTISLTNKDGKSYATTCAPVPVKLSESDAENTTLYIEKSHTENKISFGKAEAVAANTGIFIENTNGDASVTLLFAKTGDESEATSPILAGTTVKLSLPADREDYRTLGFNAGGEIGFFKPASSIAAIPANRAFLYLNGISLTNAFYIDFDGTTTSIDELLPAADVLGGNAPVYDLSGRRMQGTLHKGIYIQNGRKFMVK